MDNKEKIRKYCVYQERSCREVRVKITQLGIHGREAEQLIEELIEDKYVDDERFTACFIRGKMNTKCWGRLKLQNELLKKGISSDLIYAQLSQIDEDGYDDNIQKLIEKWRRTNPDQDSTKLYRFLLSKGYESFKIAEMIKTVSK